MNIYPGFYFYNRMKKQEMTPNILLYRIQWVEVKSFALKKINNLKLTEFIILRPILLFNPFKKS